MIKVKFNSHASTRYLCLSVEGHAGASEPGHDLVCASASILAYTVAQVVKGMEIDCELVDEPYIELNEGDACIIICCKNDDIYAKARHTFFVAQTGYALLEHNYPQYVELELVGEAITA